MALRSIARNRLRTIATIASLTVATSIILPTLILYESTWFLVDFQFDHVMHSDIDISLRDSRYISAIYDAAELPGVDTVEPLFTAICDLRKGYRSRRVAITGLLPPHRLLTPMQPDLRPVTIPPAGLVLSRKLAQILAVGEGDRLELTPVRGRRRTVSVPVAGIIHDYLGMNVYADLHYLCRIVGEPEATNTFQLVTNPARLGETYEAIRNLPITRSVRVRADARSAIEDTIVRTMGLSLGLMIIFAAVIALGSVLNASLIEITDRAQDVATLRALGYGPGAVAGIFFRQNVAIFLLSLALAGPLGYGAAILIARAYDTELFRMPVIVRASTIIISVAMTLAFVMVAQLFVYRYIRKLDWPAYIKVKE